MTRALSLALLVVASPLRGAAAQQVDTTLWTRLQHMVGTVGLK